MKEITDKTLIPIGLAVLSIGGGAAWLTDLHVATASNSEMARRIELKQDRYNEELQEINDRLSRIEGELKRISK